MARLANKVALITGATGGIGAATAKAYLREGAKVMLVGRSEGKLAETSKALGHADATATFATDATDESGTRGAGGLDIVFANAGTEGPVKPLVELTVDDFEQIMQTNVIGAWLTIKQAVGALTERGGGAVIATSSIAGAIGFPGLSAYVASKHAVNGLVKTAALELAASGIRVNAIAPGMIDNRMLHSIAGQMDTGTAEEVLEGLTPLVPMQRLGRSEEIAELAVFLGSDESSYCTGSVHLMDGGYVAA